MKRWVQTGAVRVCHDYSELTSDQLRTHVVGMTADAQGQPSPLQNWFHQRTQVGNKTVVSRNQLIQLPSGREVLILKAMCLAELNITEGATNNLFINGCQFFTHAGEKTREP